MQIPTQPTPLVSKKGKKGFFILVAIIALVILFAYYLTVKNTQLTNTGGDTSSLTPAERQQIVEQFVSTTPPTAMSKKEKEAAVKSITPAAGAGEQKPLTEAERKQLVDQFLK